MLFYFFTPNFRNGINEVLYKDYLCVVYSMQEDKQGGWREEDACSI